MLEDGPLFLLFHLLSSTGRRNSTTAVWECANDLYTTSGKDSLWFTRFSEAAAGPGHHPTARCSSRHQGPPNHGSAGAERRTSRNSVTTKTCRLRALRRVPGSSRPCFVEGCTKQGHTLYCSSSEKDWCRHHYDRDRVETDKGRKTRTGTRDIMVVCASYFNPRGTAGAGRPCAPGHGRCGQSLFCHFFSSRTSRSDIPAKKTVVTGAASTKVHARRSGGGREALLVARWRRGGINTRRDLQITSF